MNKAALRAALISRYTIGAIICSLFVVVPIYLSPAPLWLAIPITGLYACICWGIASGEYDSHLRHLQHQQWLAQLEREQEERRRWIEERIAAWNAAHPDAPFNAENY